MIGAPRITIAAILSALVLAGPASGEAGALPPSTRFSRPTYGALHWRSIGPFRGGRVLAVEGAPDDPLHFYFGAVNGGVWETRDAGRTWTPDLRRSEPVEFHRRPGDSAVGAAGPSTSAQARRTCAPTSPRASACSESSDGGASIGAP